LGVVISAIARFLGVEPNPEDQVFGSEQLDQVTFEQMNFYNVEAGCLCCIYLGD